MGIWIRSQDRKTLTNVNDIYIRLSGKGCAICTGKGMDLGVYLSEEKALKVIDSIQGAITGKDKRNVVVSFNNIEYHNVFKMPKDDEVNTEE